VGVQSPPQVRSVCRIVSEQFLLADCANSYAAEVGIWTGIWALSSTALQHPFFPRLTPAVAVISPLFTWFLTRRVSEPSCSFDAVLTIHYERSRVFPRLRCVTPFLVP
jgi:hypothetical protein